MLFARNRLCALVRPGLEVTSASLLGRMLDPLVKLGISTPKADPSGDYAWELFQRAGKVSPGASATLEKKALQLTGGPSSPPVPQGRSVYGELVAQGAADIFLTYCTNAMAAQRENPAQQIVPLPDALAVGADYGLTVMNGASVPAYRFRALHPLGGRPADAREARFCGAGPGAIGEARCSASASSWPR